MASSKSLAFIAIFLLAADILMVTEAQPASKMDCPSKCHVRCSKNWKNKMCNKICNICYNKCNRVPSGTTQATRDECPCYANLKNSKNGKLKCP